jgi:dihydrofolate reductase
MSKVYLHLSISLDGFITGPNEGADDEGLERLHVWMFDGKTDADAEIRDHVYSRTGAILIGRRMFDVGVEPWGDPPPFHMPVFILTHEARDPMPMQGGTTYTFVTDGIEAGLEQARAAAGDKDIGIWGGAGIAQQYLKAGLLDEMLLALIPVLLGDGIRLFENLGPDWIELDKARTIETPNATHLRYTIGNR